ncbi:hypothetical protein A2U01_0013272, partial [Trifolium medium]|nr:hypothetical protein [Trifolium medium]
NRPKQLNIARCAVYPRALRRSQKKTGNKTNTARCAAQLCALRQDQNKPTTRTTMLCAAQVTPARCATTRTCRKCNLMQVLNKLENDLIDFNQTF